MSNKQRYKETFDTMMLSEERIRKVKSMIEKNNRISCCRIGSSSDRRFSYRQCSCLCGYGKYFS